MLFDTHAHYDDSRFEEDRLEVIKSAFDSGVSHILNVAADMASLQKCLALSEKFDFIYAAVGVHPHNVGEMNDQALATLAELSSKPKVVAIGEIGLDYYYDNSPRDTQKLWFAKQIGLAKDLNLPVIVHDRDAHEDTLNIIKEESAKTVGGVFHCYSGSVEMAKEVLNNNFYISIAGPVTFKNAKKLIEVVSYVPDDRLLIETDCPYLTPEPFRGKRNDSRYIKYTAEKIAEIKGCTLEEIAQITMKNAKRLFRIG